LPENLQRKQLLMLGNTAPLLVVPAALAQAGAKTPKLPIVPTVPQVSTRFILNELQKLHPLNNSHAPSKPSPAIMDRPVEQSGRDVGPLRMNPPISMVPARPRQANACAASAKGSSTPAASPAWWNNDE
jgi:hypothetical protein